MKLHIFQLLPCSSLILILCSEFTSFTPTSYTCHLPKLSSKYKLLHSSRTKHPWFCTTCLTIKFCSTITISNCNILKMPILVSIKSSSQGPFLNFLEYFVCFFLFKQYAHIIFKFLYLFSQSFLSSNSYPQTHCTFSIASRKSRSKVNTYKNFLGKLLFY